MRIGRVERLDLPPQKKRRNRVNGTGVSKRAQEAELAGLGLLLLAKAARGLLLNGR